MLHQDTQQHARKSLATVDPDFQLVEAYRFFLESPARKAKGEKNDDLNTWLLARIKDLCGVTSFKDALKHRDCLTLLAFGYLGFVRRPDLLLPRVRQSTPIPKGFAKIEPDFFPVLLKEIRSNAAQSPSFGAQLKTAEQTIKQLVPRLEAIPNVKGPNSSNLQPPIAAAASDSPADAIPFLFLIFVVSGVIAKVKKAT